MEYPPAQSSWGRAKQDTVAAQKTARFMWGGESVLAVAGGTWLAQIAPIGAPTFEIVARSVIGGLGGLFTAAVMIFAWNLFRAPYRQRNEGRAKVAQLLQERKKDEFYFEFNDSSLSWRDGSKLMLGVTYSANRITIETLQLDYNGKRFRPRDWLPIEINVIHTQNYTFDLNALRAVADDSSQEAVFIAKANGIEYRSPPFNIYKLL